MSIYVSLYHHIDAGKRDPIAPGSAQTSLTVKELTNLYEKYGIKAQYGICGPVLQQIYEDFPETIEKIKKLKMPIGYHPGAGHNEPNQVGRERIVDTHKLTEEEAQIERLKSAWAHSCSQLAP